VAHEVVLSGLRCKKFVSRFFKFLVFFIGSSIFAIKPHKGNLMWNWPATLKRLGRPAFDHNIWTRNLSRSSKVSKESDCRLVSNKIFSEILASNGLGPGPNEVGQDVLKVLHLWCYSEKICTSQPKNFLECRLEDRILWAFEQHSTAFSARVMPVQSYMQSVVFGTKSSHSAGRQSGNLFSTMPPWSNFPFMPSWL